jgi:3-isopropylmalate/(R)-2-methylmalate dehydratase large subunit
MLFAASPVVGGGKFMAGMTIVEKIFARNRGLERVKPGDIVVVDVDVAVMLDMSFLATERRNILKVHDPDKIAVIFDHMVPATDKRSAEAQAYGRGFVRRFGIRRFHDVGPDQGISHAVVADRAYALPETALGVQRLAYLRVRRV